MPDGATRLYVRPEYEAHEIGAADHGDVARALSLFEHVRNINSSVSWCCGSSTPASAESPS